MVTMYLKVFKIKVDEQSYFIIYTSCMDLLINKSSLNNIAT